MTHTHTHNHPMAAETTLDALGARIARQLDHSTDVLDHDICEHLKIARMRALQQRKVVQLQPTVAYGVQVQTNHALAQHPRGGFFWGRLASLLPLLALLVGLMAIDAIQEEEQARELADVDAEILADDLPPSAFTDPGFMQFLRMHRTP